MRRGQNKQGACNKLCVRAHHTAVSARLGRHHHALPARVTHITALMPEQHSWWAWSLCGLAISTAAGDHASRSYAHKAHASFMGCKRWVRVL